MPNSLHPTKQLLIKTALALMESKLPTEISVDEILSNSGISKGSLYHHFEDLAELLEAAQVEKYAQWVDRSIEQLIAVVGKSSTIHDFEKGLMQVTRVTQSNEYADTRYMRARTIANSVQSERFRKALADVQAHLTDALEDIIREADEKGFLQDGTDHRATAVFIQSYTLGKILDDVVGNDLDSEKWNLMIDKLMRNVFLKY